MDTETLTAPVVGDNGVETPSPETQPTEQSAVEPQSTTPSQVETSGNMPQVSDTSRRKPSDHYRERQTIRELKETVSNLQKRMEERATLPVKKPDVPNVPDFDPAHFSPEHKRILLAREQAIREAYDARIAAVEQKFTGWQQSQADIEVNRKHQEALEKLFPKTSPDSKESLQERISKDPERAMRIKEFLIESGLNEFSKINPDMAVEIALQRLGDPRKANPTVLKKTLMGGSGTGNPGMGDKRSISESDLRSENKKLSDQLSSNPSLRQDVKFMERRAQILSDLERLVAKK